MNTPSAFRAEARGQLRATRGALLKKFTAWEAPVWLFHWLMVFTFGGAWLTAESERWRLAHVTLGYTMAALVVFRLLWGLIGARRARLLAMLRAPRSLVSALKAQLSGVPERVPQRVSLVYLASMSAIVALLALAALVTASGWIGYEELAGHWFEDVHSALANLMLFLIGAHLAAVLLSSWRSRATRIATPRAVRPGLRLAQRSVAAVMLTAVLSFWWLQWQDAASANPAGNTTVASAGKHRGDHHED
jgi:cytochrome b